MRIKLNAYKDAFSFIYLEFDSKLKEFFSELKNGIKNEITDDSIRSLFYYEAAGRYYNLEKGDSIFILSNVKEDTFTFWIEADSRVLATAKRSNLQKRIDDTIRKNELIVIQELKRRIIYTVIESTTFDARLLLSSGFNLKTEEEIVDRIIKDMNDYLSKAYFSIFLNELDEMIRLKKIELQSFITTHKIESVELIEILISEEYKEMCKTEKDFWKINFDKAKAKFNSVVNSMIESQAYTKCRNETKYIINKNISLKNRKPIEE